MCSQERPFVRARLGSGGSVAERAHDGAVGSTYTTGCFNERIRPKSYLDESGAVYTTFPPTMV